MSCTPDNRFSETAPFLLQRMSLFMAQPGNADPAAQCPLSGEERKTSARSEYSAFDPQETFQAI
jgi:hypothetical protein